MNYMQPHGQIYLGLSESLMGVNLPVEHIGHSIYGKKNYIENKKIETVPEFSKPNLEASTSMSSLASTSEDIDTAKPIMTDRTGPIRVMAVDDSPTVLELIANLLSKRPDIQSIVLPLSGGGLAAGIALAVKETNPKIKVFGVTMENGAAMHVSIKNGKPTFKPWRFWPARVQLRGSSLVGRRIP